MAQTRTTNRSGGAHDAPEARIGSAARVRGRIHGDGDLLVEGHVEGSVTLRGDLTIAEGASVSSESVSAHAVFIAGTLEGNVAATGVVRLAPGARVRGDVQGNAVTIDDGAHFTGRLDCEFELPPELGGASQGEARARASARR
jgi:cytoskeletal protein CcmA (bactofilin family)